MGERDYFDNTTKTTKIFILIRRPKNSPWE